MSKDLLGKLGVRFGEMEECELEGAGWLGLVQEAGWRPRQKVQW